MLNSKEVDSLNGQNREPKKMKRDDMERDCSKSLEILHSLMLTFLS